MFKYLGKKHILRLKSNLHEYFDLWLRWLSIFVVVTILLSMATQKFPVTAQIRLRYLYFQKL